METHFKNIEGKHWIQKKNKETLGEKELVGCLERSERFFFSRILEKTTDKKK